MEMGMYAGGQPARVGTPRGQCGREGRAMLRGQEGLLRQGGDAAVRRRCRRC